MGFGWHAIYIYNYIYEMENSQFMFETTELWSTLSLRSKAPKSFISDEQIGTVLYHRLSVLHHLKPL